MSDSKFAFIIGTGRCGTSWLGQMLNSQAEICVPPELQLLFEYSDNGNRLFEEFSLAGQSGLDGERLASIIERGCPHKLEMFFDYPEFCRRVETPKNSVGDFVTALYSAIAKAHGKSMLIEQTPWYGQRLDLVSKFFPEAKFIHVIRDGRDVALSFARTPWWHNSPQLNLARWQREIKKITLDAASFLHADLYMEVKYEDLVANTRFELERICKFLRVDFDAEMLNPKGFIDYDQFCKFDVGQISSRAYSAWRERKDTAIFSDNVEAWRRTDNVFQEPLPREISDWLFRYGYDAEVARRDEVEALQHREEYSFRALESVNLAQAGRIHDLEHALTRQSAHIAGAERELARVALIDQTGKAVESQLGRIMEMVERQSQLSGSLELSVLKQAENIEIQDNHLKDLIARLDGISCEEKSVAKNIASLTQRYSEQSESVKRISEIISGIINDKIEIEKENLRKEAIIEKLEMETRELQRTWHGSLRRLMATKRR